MHSIAKECKYETAVTATAGAAAQTPINGSVVDTLGFDSLAVVVNLGTLAAGAVTSLKLQQGKQANLSDAADLAGSALSIPDTADDGVAVLEVVKPRERYIRLVVSRGTANATIASATYVLFNARTVDTTPAAGSIIKSIISPAEGTA